MKLGRPTICRVRPSSLRHPHPPRRIRARAPRADPPGPPRHRLEPLRRPRRLDQHHAADLPEPGLRGDPPRPQPLGRGGRRRRDRGGRAGRRGRSYQGGHIEYFEYLVESLRGAGRRPRARSSAAAAASSSTTRSTRLRESGVHASSPPRTASAWAWPAMINPVVARLRRRPRRRPAGPSVEALLAGERSAIARGHHRRRDRRPRRRGPAASSARPPRRRTRARPRHHRHGGSGKSSPHRRARPPLPPRPAGQAAHRRARRRPHAPQGRRGAARRPHPDELARRRPRLLPQPRHARRATSCPSTSTTCSPSLKAAGFDLVVVETPGIGQGDAAIVPFVDVPLYVMTPEFGAASQLEKIDMLDFADAVAINKFERRGAEDALRDVGRQLVRNREAFGTQPDDMPVFGTRPPASTTTASPRSTSTCATCSRSTACRSPRASCPRSTPRRSSRLRQVVPGRPGALPRRDRRDRPRLPRRRPSARRPGPPGAAARGRRDAELEARGADRRGVDGRCSSGPRGARRRGREAARRLAGRSSSPTPATSRS